MLDISTIFASQSHAPLSSTLPSSSRAFEQLHILARGQQNYDDGQYEEEYDYYQEDYDNPPQSGRGPIPRSRKSGGLAIDLKDRFTSLLELLRNHKQLGASLLGLGLLLTFAGMMLFFEGTLLRLGNMCIIAGIPLLVGPEAVKNFFIKKERTQATAIVSIGILLVFWGKPRIGILCEIFGILNLFGNMNPLVLSLIKKMPVIGDMLSAFDKKASSNSNSNDSNRERPVRGGPSRGPRYPRRQYNEPTF